MRITGSGLYIRNGVPVGRLARAKPEARFLLEAVLRMAILGERWSGKKNDLAGRLSLTKDFVSVGVDGLVDAGLLIKISAVTERRGRPEITYEVNGEIRNDLRRLETPFSPLFDALFLGAKKASGVSLQMNERLLAGKSIDGKSKKFLSPYNRLLLAVLLDHANEVGLVVGVSRSDLQGMTGFNDGMVRNRLAVLMKYELVKFHAPGFASARFPGGKVKSSFILNHDLLPSAKKLSAYEHFSVEGGHLSSAAGNLYKQGGFVVSRESMLGVWLMAHRFVSITLSTLRCERYLENKKAVAELIMSTLRTDSPSKTDGVDFDSLCKDLAEWVVYLANRYIEDHCIQKEECVWILPYGKWEMSLIRWKTAQSVV